MMFVLALLAGREVRLYHFCPGAHQKEIYFEGFTQGMGWEGGGETHKHTNGDRADTVDAVAYIYIYIFSPLPPPLHAPPNKTMVSTVLCLAFKVLRFSQARSVCYCATK